MAFGSWRGPRWIWTSMVEEKLRFRILCLKLFYVARSLSNLLDEDLQVSCMHAWRKLADGLLILWCCYLACSWYTVASSPSLVGEAFISHRYRPCQLSGSPFHIFVLRSRASIYSLKLKIYIYINKKDSRLYGCFAGFYLHLLQGNNRRS